MNLLLLALVPACFAMNPVTGKALIGDFGPATLALMRWLLSALVIAALALARGRRERWGADGSHLARVAVLGALGMGFCAYAAFEASRTTAATNIGLIYGCASALIAAWEIGAGRQRASAALLLGIAARLAGVVLILTRGRPDVLLGLGFTPGDLWAAAGSGMFVVYTIAMRRTPAALTPLTQFAVMGLGASLALFPVAVAEVALAGLPQLHPYTPPWVATLVLVTGIGAFLGYNVALARNGPVLTSAALTLTPVYAAVLAVLLIGEELAWYHAAALVLVVCGLMLVNRDQTRR